MSRPRITPPTYFQPNEPGSLTFDRKDLIAETPATVGNSGMCFAGREFARMKVKILVLRD